MKKKISKVINIFAVLLIIIGVIFQLTYKPVTKYKIAFDSNGGTKIDDIYVKEGDSFMPPKDPLKLGYFFLGWYLESGEQYNFNNKVMQDINLKAAWSDN